MIADTRVRSHAPEIEADVETLPLLAVFCGIGLTVSLLLAGYGLDFSAGFFCWLFSLARALKASGLVNSRRRTRQYSPRKSAVSH
jgi:hypothetical protein